GSPARSANTAYVARIRRRASGPARCNARRRRRARTGGTISAASARIASATRRSTPAGILNGPGTAVPPPLLLSAPHPRPLHRDVGVGVYPCTWRPSFPGIGFVGALPPSLVSVCLGAVPLWIPAGSG